MKIRTRMYFWMINKFIPESLKPYLKKIMYLFLDVNHYIRHGSSGIVPPPSKVFIGTGGYLKTGEEFADYFTRLGDLKASHSVLDVGCGTGRMAIPLTHILDKSGSYVGMDIVKDGVDWASKAIGSKYTNFNFIHSNIFNELYNPKGADLASEYTFPFADNKFDFIFLTSVFTHMLRDDLENYLKQISRVLKPGGRCLITYFLLNDESMVQISKGKSTIDFKYPHGDCLTNNAEIPEDAIAYREENIRAIYSDLDMTILDPISYGSWCDRPNYLSYQDIIIATKNI